MATAGPKKITPPLFRTILGLLASGLLLLSAGAHAVLGWPAVRKELTAAKLSPDLITGIMVAWQFGGMTMFVLGGLLGEQFLRRWKGLSTSPFPAFLVGGAYVLFGMSAMVWLGFQVFYLVFIVPGIMLLFAGWAR